MAESTTTAVDTRPTVLITGCSTGGIGEALAFEFKFNDYRVFATARKEASMGPLRAAGIEVFELDVTKQESIDAMKERVLDLTGGKLDVLVNNAGQSYPYAVADASLDRVRALFDVNFFGAFAMVQAFLPLLLASSKARILNVGSVAGVMPVPFGAAYNASKAALHSFGDTLRVELAPFNVKVMTAVLGNVASNIIKMDNAIPEGSLYYPIQDIYRDKRVVHFMDEAAPRETVCRGIVAALLRRNPTAWWWGGKRSWMFWFIHTFLPRRGFDYILSAHFGIKKLAALLKQKRKDV